MIGQVERRVQAGSLADVETQVGSVYDMPPDDASVEHAFLITVLPKSLAGRARWLNCAVSSNRAA
jgi:hypothetical protein